MRQFTGVRKFIDRSGFQLSSYLGAPALHTLEFPRNLNQPCQVLSDLLTRRWTRGAQPLTTMVSVCELVIDIQVHGLQIHHDNFDTMGGFKCTASTMPRLQAVSQRGDHHIEAIPAMANSHEPDVQHKFRFTFAEQKPRDNHADQKSEPVEITISVQAERLVCAATSASNLEIEWLSSFVASQ